MKFRVQLKSRVTAWVEVEFNDDAVQEMVADGGDPREWAANDAVDVESARFRKLLQAGVAGTRSGMDVEYGPIELAHEELDESVRVVA